MRQEGRGEAERDLSREKRRRGDEVTSKLEALTQSGSVLDWRPIRERVD